MALWWAREPPVGGDVKSPAITKGQSEVALGPGDGCARPERANERHSIPVVVQVHHLKSQINTQSDFDAALGGACLGRA